MEWRRFEISTVGNGKTRKRGITLEKIKISKKNFSKKKKKNLKKKKKKKRFYVKIGKKNLHKRHLTIYPTSNGKIQFLRKRTWKKA